MKKQIKLHLYGGSLVDREPLFFADGETLELSFDSPYRLDNAFLVVSSGNKKELKIRIEDETRIPVEYIVAGVLNLEVIITARGEIAKRIRIEPIIIKEIDGTLSAIPEIDYLKSTLQSLSEEYAATVKELEEYKSAVAGQFQSIIEAHNKLAEQVKVLLEEQAL